MIPQSAVPRRLAPVIAVAVLLASLAGMAQASVQKQPAQPADQVDVRVNQTTTADQQEPTLAVDPTNPNNVLAAAKDWRTGPKQVWDYRSTDGGRTWADGYPNLMPPELPNQSDPVVDFDSSGAAYLAVLGYNPSDFSVGGLFVSRSSDVGASWRQAVEVSANTKDVFNDKEWLVVDRSNNASTKGNVYITWTLFTTVSPTRQKSQIVTSSSTDGGKTFSPRRAITPAAQEAVQGSYPVVGPNGEITVLYFDTPGSPVGSEQQDGAADSASTSSGAVDNAMQVGTGDALYVVRSTDAGQTFGQPIKVADVKRPPDKIAHSQFRVYVLPTLAADPNNGALYATWNDYATGVSAALLAASKDGGRTWSTAKRVSDAPDARHDQFFPTAVVGKDSVLHVFWLDRRDDPSNKLYRPYYTRSTDGGATFMKNVPLTGSLSDPSIGFEGTLLGDYISLTVSNDAKRIYTAWVDTRGGAQDIYFTSVSATAQLPDLPLSPPTPESTTVPVPSPQPLTGFNNRAFITNWERADRAVLTGKTQRPWVWGPASFGAANEQYKQGQNGQREVLYFDKARMEINITAANPADPGYVTNGLLVVELISGRVQLGNTEFAPPRPPSDIPVAGDINSPDALTYASLAPVASLNGDNRATDRTGQGVTAVLNRDGHLADDPTKAGAVKLVAYESILGHNIPDVFWTFMNASGLLYNWRFDTYSNGQIFDWVSALGYPITEPYWTNVQIGGITKSVLVQAFQRRVLTYVADNPPGWQVEMGNVGRHYFDWRYAGVKR